MSASAFSPRVRQTIQLRAMGRCEVCGKPSPVGSGAQAHHRLPRGSGGSSNPVKGQASNGLWVCLDCHGRIERNTPEVYANGWKVRHGRMPAQVPVVLATPYGRGMWLLDDGGCYLPVEAA